MIHLDPPYQVINGHTLLPDHADEGLFYAIPPSPRLALTADGRPMFSLLEFLNGGGTSGVVSGGLLNLSLELTIPEDTLSSLEALLKQKAGLTRPVRITPVLFDDGVVELIALGATSAVPPAPADATTAPDPALPVPTGPFNVHFLGTARPSLGGNNTASFQLVLDANAAELVDQTLDSADVPMIAIYRLGFAGLRPSFKIDVKADWHKVYDSLQNKLNANLYYVGVDAEVKVTEALESCGVVIDTSVFGTGPDAHASAERARKQLMEWVFERLFTALTDQTAATANAIGEAIDGTVSSLVRSVVPGVSYRLRKVEEDQLRAMSARMNESVAERREIVPQGSIGGLLRRFRLAPDGSPRPDWPATRDALVKKVNLDRFPRLEVQVAVEDRFASDGLSQVLVDMRRLTAAGTPTNGRSMTFRSAAEREPFVANLLGLADPRLSIPYEYRQTVQFDTTSRYGFHEPVAGSWHTGFTTELFVEPRAADTYMVRAITIALAPTFSFSQFSAVTVEVRANTPNTPDFQTGRAELDEQHLRAEWRYRSFGATVPGFEYRATFHRPADRGGPVTGSWTPYAEDWLSVPDPLPRKRLLTILSALQWAQVQLAFVELRYVDVPNGIRYDEQIDLTAASAVIRRDIPIAIDGPATLSYRLTIIFVSGTLVEGAWRETDDTRIVLDRRVVDMRPVRVHTIGGSLRDNHLAQVRLRLQVREPGRDTVRAETDMRIEVGNGDETFAPWEYLVGDPPVQTIHYDAVFVDDHGFTKEVTWRPTAANVLVLNLRTQSVIA